MCGIAGVIRQGGLSAIDHDAVLRMTSAQAHRGPDGADCLADGVAALGHRRLAIIDLSTLGAQPMSNEARTVWVTFNGEIYNFAELRYELVGHGHRFRSHTDTEVLVHGYEQWGLEGLLSRLCGMFAFGLYDAEQRVMLLVRDQLGIKPLYYHVNESSGVLLFASEVKALLCSGIVPDDQDPDAVVGFLLAGSVPAPKTIAKHVSALMPGHYLRWSEGRISAQRYWTAPRESTVQIDPQEAIATIRTQLTQAIRRHLVSDAPVGIFLGGGVDSAAVVAFAARESRGADGIRAAANHLKTLTVTFDEEEFTEADAACRTARRFTTDHREVHVTRADFIAELPSFFAAMDQPTNDGINTYFVSRAARQAGLKVVLSGLGGDEVFWGYSHYRRLASIGWLSRAPWPIRPGLAWTATAWGRAIGRDRWMRAAFLRRSGSPADMYLFMRGFFPPEHVRQLLGISRAELQQIVDRQFPMEIAGGQSSADAAFNQLEFDHYLHDQLLRDADVFSMAHSIEVRVPLLDRAVVEFVKPLSRELKMRRGLNKPLLVEAAADEAVAAAGQQAKRGFTLPMERWVLEAGPELEARALDGNLFDRKAVSAVWDAFRDQRVHWSRVWALTVLGSLKSAAGRPHGDASTPAVRVDTLAMRPV